MYSLSSIAHAVLQQLKPLDYPTPSRAQMLELIAAYIDYKTYAAFKADLKGQDVKLKASILDSWASKTRLKSRLVELTLPESLSEPIVQCICKHLQTLKPEPEINLLRVAQHLQLVVGNSQLYGKELKASYDYLVNSHENESALLRYVWQVAEFEEIDTDSEDEYDYDRGSAYWYQQRQKGNNLSDAANEWADLYELKLAAKKGKEDFISSYAGVTLAKPNAVDVIRENAEPNFCCRLDANHLLSIFQRFPISCITPDFGYEWYYLNLVQDPNHEDLVQMARSSDDPIEVWAWYFFGASNEIDITADNLLEAHSSEEVASYNFIKLPEIPESQKCDAQLMAKRMQNLMNLAFHQTNK